MTAKLTNLTSLALEASTLDRVYAILERRRKGNRTLSRAEILREVVETGLREIEKADAKPAKRATA